MAGKRSVSRSTAAQYASNTLAGATCELKLQKLHLDAQKGNWI